MSSNSTDALAYRRGEDRASYGVPITIVCPAIALILVALRIYSRAFLVRKVFWEDYIVVAAMASSISISVLIVIAFSNGNGRHFETVSAAEFIRLRKISPGIYIAYAAAHVFAKLSIVLQYTRISVIYRSTTSADKTWDAVPSGLYAIIEINVGIACSCVVTLRPLFGRWRWLSSGGKAKPPQAITPARKPPRPMDPFSVGTDSTQVLTVSDDVELGSIRAGSRSGEDGEAAPPPAAQCRAQTPAAGQMMGSITSKHL
ncbi:hypothetical protein GGTG_04531 [Gaeumannomyces tritici R3-111a-1]|uniref:Rhodopsin domain-containing protein n=1 Tax=Gaeumannomyces tritici (strain R3-111a-1) TaxID=644352 RepID=J3NTD2_GAET3|nr:hypothetical protein GGTG_04531 [Gaeumannomyces tritici R3-111a-1]EJT79447.1 hypothetical protein GGTG_04531 [Gaeumannomyces tritici R3-111a-1]